MAQTFGTIIGIVSTKSRSKNLMKGQVYFFKEYEITNGDQKLNFVAGEFVNSKVGIYIKDDLRRKT